MKYKTVQAAHEIRMWTIALATGFIAAKKYVDTHPAAAEWLDDKVSRVTSKFKKKEEPKTEEKIIKVMIIRED
ncbi:MAG: hypothetical protein J6U54_10080 [Clostridiales bacterium]|nr:hypothetical protein [Clostridiales bacterium]